MNRPALMGIVNVTPDSFSGDGRLATAAIEHAKILTDAGADILDLGAESTRPGATVLTADEEWARLGPVLEGIIIHPWRARVRLSVDTRHAQTASRALALGVEIINDVGGLADPAMVELLAEHECDVVVMHALGLPADPARTIAEDEDVLEVVRLWKHQVTEFVAARGIATERLIYDPGVGFGKTATQSLTLVLGAETLVDTGGRWLFGHSRKSFLKLFGEENAAARDGLTLAFSAQLAAAGVEYMRVHNVARHAALFGQLCM